MNRTGRERETAPVSVCSERTAAALELPALLALVARLAGSDLGRREIEAAAPLGRPELEARRERYEEARRLLGERPLVSAFDAPLAPLVERLDGGQPPVAGPDLLRLAAALRATLDARERALAADPACPALAALTAPLPDLTELVRTIGRALDRRGEVRDDASRELVRLRREIQGVRDVLYRDLQGLLGRYRDEVSEETIPLRGGRLVLMLQAGARGRAQGLVHGRSATGKSFYFEPLEVVEGNNRLQQAVEDEEAERARIVAELVAAARRGLPGIREHFGVLAELDLLQAAARFADRADARLPDLPPDGAAALPPGAALPPPPGGSASNPNPGLRLVAARHPLLDPRLAALREAVLGEPGHMGEIVPLDLELGTGDASRILVVTGPNAGGKTVALKTTGLLALAAQCGLPVPAAPGTRLPAFSRVVATVGDDQDLLRDRSTFSGRLLRLQEAWDAAGPGSLILLDELGSGTDPEEGSALAVALLEGLLAKGAVGLLTTHLTPLAAAALEREGAGCAAMEFDPVTGRPTYRLLPGPPGGSEAIALARRLGLPDEWLGRAEELLGSAHRELRRLLTEVERVRQELGAERDAAGRERRELAAARRRLEEEQEAAAAERKTIAQRLRRELEAFRRQVAARLRAEEAALRAAFEAGRRKGVAAEATDRLFAAAPRVEGVEEATPGPLEVGAAVRHRGLGWEGTLARLEGDEAEVTVRGKRLRCAAAELAPAAEGSAGGPAPAPRGGAGGAVEAPSSGAVAGELQLIGRRVEPALEELDGYLDRALLAGRDEVRIVHGHGTGRLREAVREHLRRHPAVTSQRPGRREEGGDGATVVTLRG